MRAFLHDRRGNVAIFTGILLIPVMGLAGAAVDYNRAVSLKNRLQTQADVAALNAVLGGTEADYAPHIAHMTQHIQQSYGSGALTDLSVSGQWTSVSDFRVEASGRIDTTIVHILPGVDRGMGIAVESVARLNQQMNAYEPPELSWLDPDAGDYNRIYAYCFDYEGTGSKASRRSQMTLIADNDGNDYEFDWPVCEDGESLSFRLENIRHVRAYPYLWDQPNRPPGRPEFNYYTDTTLVDGVEHFDIGYDILETVRCDSIEECVGESQGGVIPEGTHRDPQIEERGCAPGKYMYYGWEDRPPGQPGASATWTDPAWTDRDYDDIRIVMRCPTAGSLGQRTARLIR